MFSRGGVKDSRLEAKAKDTKKSETKDSPSEDRPSQGQGPRTQVQVFSKKIRSSKKFHAIYKFLQFKNRVVIEPRAGQFSSTGGFKHQGQGLKMCPRGLHSDI